MGGSETIKKHTESLCIKPSENWLDPATEFEELYIAESEPLFRKIRTLVKDESLARELMHETFLRAYIAKDRYIPTAPPAAWLYRIGHNLTISYIRKQNTEIKYSPLFREEMQEIDIKKIDTKIALGKAMRFLNKNEREVIDMYYFQDLSDGMIGDKLGIPVATARSRRRVAIEKMRIELGVV